MPQLLWSVDPPSDGFGKYLDYLPGYDGSETRGDEKAPSWSWVSVSWPVVHHFEMGFVHRLPFVRPRAEVLSCITTPLHDSSPFGRVCGDLLTIQGECQVLRMTISLPPAGEGIVACVHFPDEEHCRVICVSLRSIPGGFDGQAQTVTLLHLVEYYGLILTALSDDCFKRIGRYRLLLESKADEQERGALRFLKDCETRTLVIE